MDVTEKNRKAIRNFSPEDHYYLGVVGKGNERHLKVIKRGLIGQALMKLGLSSSSMVKVAEYINTKDLTAFTERENKGLIKLKEKLEHYSKKHPKVESVSQAHFKIEQLLKKAHSPLRDHAPVVQEQQVAKHVSDHAQSVPNEPKRISPATQDAIKRLNTFLAKSNEKIGTAIDNGDCFFDAVGQKLAEFGKIPHTDRIKTIRSAVQESAPSNLEIIRKFAQHDIHHVPEDSYLKYIGHTCEELEELNKSIRKRNEHIDSQIDSILNQLEDDEDNEDLNAEFAKLSQQRVPELYPIWGSELREGRMLSEKYQVTVKVCICLEEGEPKWISITHPKGATYDKEIKVALYSGHFVPVDKIK